MKARKYYDRPGMLAALEAAERQGALDESGVLSLRDPELPKALETTTALWQMQVRYAAERGLHADLSPFSSLVVLDNARGESQAAAMLGFAEGLIGRFDQAPRDLAAFQIIMKGRQTLFRSHAKIRGVFVSILWNGVRGPALSFAWELLAEEREVAAHVTVIRGTVGKVRGALVFHNLQPAMVRSLSDERFASILDTSLRIPGARARLKGARRKGITDADVRSHFFEQMKAGTHPIALASSTVDALTRSARMGLAGLSHKLVPLDPEGLGPSSDHVDPAEGPEAAMDREQAGEELREALEGLGSRAFDMVARWAEGETQERIAAVYGISQERVGQIIRKAHTALRRRLSP